MVSPDSRPNRFGANPEDFKTGVPDNPTNQPEIKPDFDTLTPAIATLQQMLLHDKSIISELEGGTIKSGTLASLEGLLFQIHVDELLRLQLPNALVINKAEILGSLKGIIKNNNHLGLHKIEDTQFFVRSNAGIRSYPFPDDIIFEKEQNNLHVARHIVETKLERNLNRYEARLNARRSEGKIRVPQKTVDLINFMHTLQGHDIFTQIVQHQTDESSIFAPPSTYDQFYLKALPNRPTPPNPHPHYGYIISPYTAEIIETATKGILQDMWGDIKYTAQG